MRYVSGMAHREEFRFAAEVADGLMSVFYVLLGEAPLLAALRLV